MSHQGEKGLQFKTAKCCKMFGVSRSGYYSWKKKREKLAEITASKELEEQDLMRKFREVVKKLGYVPGKRTFRTFLWRDYNISISVKRCLLMSI